MESGHPLRAAIYPALVRAAAGLLTAISGGSLLGILALLLLSEGPVNPLRLIRLVAAFCVLPALLAAFARYVFAAKVRVDGDTLVFEQRGRRVEIPLGSVVAIEPWLLPLPATGFWIRLESGRRWSDGVEMQDPIALVDALVDGGAPPRIGEAAEHPSLIYARARYRSAGRSWRRVLFKFPIFALGPTLPLFRVHQIIAYGGTFGEYYQYGLGAYLAGFTLYWATITIYLVLYAAALRVPVELLAVASALAIPQRARSIRRLLDRLSAVLYYAGVPTLLVLRFVPW